MDIETIEELADAATEIHIDDVDIEGIEEVFAKADEMRDNVVAAFKQECGVDNVLVAAGGIRQQAYWGWESVVHARGEAFASSIEMLFEDSRCDYTICISRVIDEDEFEEWTAGDECDIAVAAEEAFEAFHRLILEIAESDDRQRTD